MSAQEENLEKTNNAACRVCGIDIDEKVQQLVQFSLGSINEEQRNNVMTHPAYGEIFVDRVIDKVCAACSIPVMTVANASYNGRQVAMGNGGV